MWAGGLCGPVSCILGYQVDGVAPAAQRLADWSKAAYNNTIADFQARRAIWNESFPLKDQA